MTDNIPLSPCQMYFALARKLAVDIVGHISFAQSIKEKLLENFYPRSDYGDTEHNNFIIRCNRTIKFLSKQDSFYTIGEIGHGQFGRVDLVALKGDNNALFALKNISIPKRKILSTQYAKIIVEKECLWECDNNRYVVPMISCWIEHGYVDKPDNICLLSEYMGYGDLNNVIKQLYPLTATGQDRKQLPGFYEKIKRNFFRNHTVKEIKKFKIDLMEHESEVILADPEVHKDIMQIIVTYIHSLIKAIVYLHSKDIVHRDIKPANVLVNDQLEIKLSDFGMATPFKCTHQPQMYGWMSQGKLSHDAYKNLYDLKDMEYQRNAIRQQRKAFGKTSEIVGTWSYLAPEYVVPDHLWEETLRHPKPYIRIRKHYPADWYSLGCVIAELCNGLHPINDVLGFYSPPESKAEKFSILNLIRINPLNKNPLLYDQSRYSMKAFKDTRILDIVRGLLMPHPEKRFSTYQILNSKQFQDLISKYIPTDQPILSYWNRYVANIKMSNSQRLLTDFEKKGPIDNESRTTKYQVHQIPESAIFPTSNTCLGSFSFSMLSPRRRNQAMSKTGEMNKNYSTTSTENNELFMPSTQKTVIGSICPHRKAKRHSDQIDDYSGAKDRCPSEYQNLYKSSVKKYKEFDETLTKQRTDTTVDKINQPSAAIERCKQNIEPDYSIMESKSEDITDEFMETFKDAGRSYPPADAEMCNIAKDFSPVEISPLSNLIEETKHFTEKDDLNSPIESKMKLIDKKSDDPNVPNITKLDGVDKNYDVNIQISIPESENSKSIRVCVSPNSTLSSNVVINISSKSNSDRVQ